MIDLTELVSVDALERFRNDTRAIEGLPIRLVIALVVGVASLSVMMGMISGIGGFGVEELDADPQPEVVTVGDSETVEVAVIDPDHSPVADATVVLQDGSAQLSGGIQTAQTGEDGIANFEISPELHSNQNQGDLIIDIKPPSGSDYTDERDNTNLLVVDEGA